MIPDGRVHPEPFKSARERQADNHQHRHRRIGDHVDYGLAFFRAEIGRGGQHYARAIPALLSAQWVSVNTPVLVMSLLAQISDRRGNGRKRLTNFTVAGFA
jgi:hypothetical protein